MLQYTRDLLLSLRPVAVTDCSEIINIRAPLIRNKRSRGCRAGRRQHRLRFELRGSAAIQVITSSCRSISIESKHKQTGINQNNLITCHRARNQSPKSSSHLISASMNVQSINNKFDVLLDYCKENRVDLFCLTETWHEENCLYFKQLIAQGHSVIDCPRPIKDAVNTVSFTNHGGVAVIGFNGVKLRRFNIDMDIRLFEYVCVHVSTQKQ